MSQIAVIVLGYGCIKTDALTTYYRHIQDYLGHTYSKMLVILCGGFTNPKERPALSEAAFAQKEIVEAGGFPKWVAVVLEELSLTTVGNLEQAKLILASHMSRTKTKPEMIVVFCETSRRFRVNFSAQRLFRVFGAKVEVRPVNFGLERSRSDRFWECCKSLPRELAGFYLGFLTRSHLDERIRRWILQSNITKTPP